MLPEPRLFLLVELANSATATDTCCSRSHSLAVPMVLKVPEEAAEGARALRVVDIGELVVALEPTSCIIKRSVASSMDASVSNGP